MGRSAFLTALFIVSVLISGTTGAFGLAFRYVGLLHSCCEVQIPFFISCASTAVFAAIIYLISERF